MFLATAAYLFASSAASSPTTIHFTNEVAAAISDTINLRVKAGSFEGSATLSRGQNYEIKVEEVNSVYYAFAIYGLTISDFHAYEPTSDKGQANIYWKADDWGISISYDNIITAAYLSASTVASSPTTIHFTNAVASVHSDPINLRVKAGSFDGSATLSRGQNYEIKVEEVNSVYYAFSIYDLAISYFQAYVPTSDKTWANIYWKADDWGFSVSYDNITFKNVAPWDSEDGHRFVAGNRATAVFAPPPVTLPLPSHVLPDAAVASHQMPPPPSSINPPPAAIKAPVEQRKKLRRTQTIHLLRLPPAHA
ncbi:tRNA(Ile)-lysidine synthase [Striga asiatica]|uniref:tRNA(Ile)-lysidine synthase n=1 Tax=Striga asiatica TaxID=4170 RepID=A0A5A7PJH2_STRAF|nr:tRNA(Ile)-lysidine synthase [Striga asiatica]